MSIHKVGQSLTKKMSLSDYNEETLKNRIPESQNSVKTEIQNGSKTEKPKKTKFSLYVSEESLKKFNEMCSYNLMHNGKADKGEMIGQAIDLLHTEFMNSRKTE